ncbi:hypothetical protein ACWGB8_02115 [Kitasatospora sp. NPDC054939]
MTTTRAGLARAASALTDLLALPGWGIVWVSCGALACIAAALRPGRDTWGFGAAAGPPLIWILAYIAASITGQYPQAWAAVPLLVAPVLLLVVVAEVTGRRRRDCQQCHGGGGRHAG